MDKTVELMIKNIVEFIDEAEDAALEKPFAVIGPAGENNGLRIYAYGGCFGTLSDKTDCKLLDRNYIKKWESSLSKEEKEISAEWIRNSRSKSTNAKAITGTWCKNVIDTPEYLSIALKVAKAKFTKTSSESKERNVQMQILKEYMNSGADWCIVDVETAFTKKWVTSSQYIKSVKKPDFVVYDKNKGFGIIELKYDNKNADNLDEHYGMFKEIYDEPEYFIKELSRRLSIMKENGLISQNVVGYEKTEKIWFGFLFVKGGNAGSKDLVKKKIGISCVDDCRYMYIDDIRELSQSGLCFESMQSIDEFMK